MSRAAASAALFTLVSNAYPWANAPSRRVKEWADVSRDQRPAMFMSGSGPTTYTWQQQTFLPKRTYEVKLYIYVFATDDNPGDPQLDAIEDALFTAMQPTGVDAGMKGRNTLGGTCFQARIKGAPIRVPGDLDADGIMLVDIEIILP